MIPRLNSSANTLAKNPKIPNALVWMQCVIFAMLYAVWMLYELLYLRRILLITGALLALYPIYQCRAYFFQKRAIPLWLMLGFFFWALFHLLFLTHDYPAQLMELRRIWKYAGLGAILAFGLGLSLAGLGSQQRTFFWPVIYMGMSLPVLIYLLKYCFTTYASYWDLHPLAYMQINFNDQSAYYIPKTDYIAFCLPVLAISLGQIHRSLTKKLRIHFKQSSEILLYLILVFSTLFLFYVQNTKNGIIYATLLIALFFALLLRNASLLKFWHKTFLFILAVFISLNFLYLHIQKNDSWRTLIADTKVAFQLEQYPHWKYAGEHGYPNNEYGEVVSITNYDRAAWFKVGLQLAANNPMGYGLVEDSFKRMVKSRWPEASPKLSHSHSGWLDLILGVGVPGFFCIFGALLLSIRQADGIVEPWRSTVFWALIANLMLWITTEVAATTSFSCLIFWISLSCGLTLMGGDQVKANQGLNNEK
ncbi:O-antigen ligase family protein [Polynucleobacter sp. MWH-Creno-3A4]|uniref:O-antigen ligase family protein n=1 Tax=Polynucleobacter sp. MWH-Creno-3A4 TaxID=1855886 RepID=UPI001C0B074C|nr:O-antigen ligase family protein [Polynucleobacter sp. MWH-Creno-3A4]